MNTEMIKQMMDAFHVAKRIRDQLPDLPEGILPSYCMVLDKIHALQEEEKEVKASMISNALHLPRPGVTRTLKEMEQKGLIVKKASATDGRAVCIELTDKGQKILERYVVDYYRKLYTYVEDIPEEEAELTCQVIRKFYEAITAMNKEEETV